MTVIPAYGRDYRSLKAVKADWESGKDFIIADQSSRWDGKPVNKSQVADEEVWVRYDKLRKKGRVQ